MDSLIAISNPELFEDDGLGAVYRPLPVETDAQGNYIINDYSEYDAAVAAENKAKENQAISPITGPAETPEQSLAAYKKFQFLAMNRPGFDYGAHSADRNRLFAREGGLGFDIFGATLDSIKKNAPGAFKGVKGSELIGNIKLPATGIVLPSWMPKISIPAPWKNAAKAAAELAKKTAAEVNAKKKAEEANNGVAGQTSNYPGSAPAPKMNMWLVGGAAVLLLGVASAMRRK